MLFFKSEHWIIPSFKNRESKLLTKSFVNLIIICSLIIGVKLCGQERI